MSFLAKRINVCLSVLLGSNCFLSGQECGQLPAAFQYSDHFYQAQAKLYEANQGFSSGASIVYDELPINGHFNGSQGVKDYESLTIDQARSYIQQEHTQKAAQIIAECGYRLRTLASSPSSMGATAISVLGEVCRQVSLPPDAYSANKLQASPTLATVIFNSPESLVREVSVANKVPGRVKVNVLVDPGSTNGDYLALDRSSFYLNTGESRKIRVAIRRPRATDPVIAIVKFVNDADSKIFATSTFTLYRDPSLLLPAPKIADGLLYPNAKMWLDIKGGPRESYEQAGPYTLPVATRGPQKANPNGGYNTEGHATYSASLNAPSPSATTVAASMSMIGEAGGRCGEGNTGGGGGFQPRWETSLTLPGLADRHSWDVQVTTDMRHYSEDNSAACNVSIGGEKRRIVEETLRSDESVAVVARRHGVNANQLFQWRKLYQAGLLGSSAEAEAGVRLLPVTVAEEAKQDRAVQELGAGAIHIEFPGRALVSLEGHVEPEMVRAVLECLRR